MYSIILLIVATRQFRQCLTDIVDSDKEGTPHPRNVRGWFDNVAHSSVVKPSKFWQNPHRFSLPVICRCLGCFPEASTCNRYQLSMMSSVRVITTTIAVNANCVEMLSGSEADAVACTIDSVTHLLLWPSNSAQFDPHKSSTLGGRNHHDPTTRAHIIVAQTSAKHSNLSEIDRKQISNHRIVVPVCWCHFRSQSSPCSRKLVSLALRRLVRASR